MNERIVDQAREALRDELVRRNGKYTLSQAQLDAYVDAAMGGGATLAPEEQIKRNPSLALDTFEPPPSYDEILTEFLRWFHRPQDARGKDHIVPHGHPSGLGGHRIYIPKNHPLPGVAARHPAGTCSLDSAFRTNPQSDGPADLA